MNIRSVDTAGRPGGSTEATASATADLLWASCRPDPDLGAADAARARGADLDWAAQVSVTQRLAPLFWRAAGRWATEEDGWSSLVRDDVARCKAQARLLRPRVKSYLLDPLASADLLPLTIKGLALCERYPDPALRPMDDVDLVVPPGTHREAVQTLIRAGWRPTPKQLAPFSVAMAHPEVPGLPVDLHHALAARSEEIFRLNASDLWEARRPVTILGAPSFGLPPEMDLLVIATHAGKLYHNFDRLIWAVDAAIVILAAGSGGSGIDWDTLAELADRAAARSALAVVLTQAERLGAASPAWMRRIDAGAARVRVLDRPRSAAWPLEPIPPAERGRLTYAVIDDPRLRVRRLGYEIVEDGALRAPWRAAVLTFRILRRIWRFRRGTPQPPPVPPVPGAGLSPPEGSAEERDEQVDPVLGDREA